VEAIQNPQVQVAFEKRLKRKKTLNKVTNYFFVVPGLIFLLCFIVYPIFYNLLISFQDVTIRNLVGERSFVGFANYKQVLGDPLFSTSLKNSVIFTSLCIIFQFVIGFAFALFFNKKFPGRNIFRSLMLIAWMLPMIITATLFKWMLAGDFGIFNHFLMSIGIIDKPIFWLTETNSALYGAIAANIWVGIPFNMIIIMAALQTLPTDLYEAAKIDGANKLQQFLNITLPLLKPTILILIMLGIIYTFKVFDLILIMTGGGPGNATVVLPYYAYQLAFRTFNFSLGATVASIMFFILIALSIVYLWLIRKEEKMS
jgi:multiple sugar transport system permease protein